MKPRECATISRAEGVPGLQGVVVGCCAAPPLPHQLLCPGAEATCVELEGPSLCFQRPASEAGRRMPAGEAWLTAHRGW